MITKFMSKYPRSNSSKNYNSFHPHYRSDIDGLRAVAILLVVGYHTFPGRISGGFIGVDIFFVISGFLISTIIFGNFECNNFSFLEFYSRRIRRIFPALSIVLLTSLCVGWFFLTPDEYKQLGKHIAGGVVFVSNFILWGESGYFDNSVLTKPFLHLWSLGIEEQFYILWPFFVWLFWSRRIIFLIVTISIFVLSFALNINRVYGDQISAFYLPQTRFWELLIGSILAYSKLEDYRTPTVRAEGFDLIVIVRRIITPNVRSLLGVFLIIICVLVVNNKMPFPGWWAVLPTFGTALVISANSTSWLNKYILSNRILVWFGLISFPLYLWHWLLLSLVYIVVGDHPTPYILILIILISIILSWLTFEIVEKPIRINKSRNLITVSLLCIMFALGLGGYICYSYDGLGFRKSLMNQVKNGDIGHEIYNEYLKKNFYSCSPILLEQFDNKYLGRCMQSKKNNLLQMIILGDSKADHLFVGLAEKLIEKNIGSLYLGFPIINNVQFGKVFEYVANDKNIQTVILSSYWYAKHRDFDRDFGKGRSFRNDLSLTVKKLNDAGKKVYLVDDIPNFPFTPHNCKYLRVRNREFKCSKDIGFINSQRDNYFSDILFVEKENKNAKILKIIEYFCKDSSCSMEKNGTVLYRDADHLNIDGSRYLGNKLVEDNPQLLQ